MAFAPLRLIMDNVIRITFPSFSRLQNEKEVLERAIEKSIFAACFFDFSGFSRTCHAFTIFYPFNSKISLNGSRRFYP